MSQQLNDNRCPKCEVTFSNWKLYNEHHFNCQRLIVPENTSGRTKAQIVDAYEAWLGERLIQGTVLVPIVEGIGPRMASLPPSLPHVEVVHDSACRCYKCQADFIAKMETAKEVLVTATKVTVLNDNELIIERF